MQLGGLLGPLWGILLLVDPNRIIKNLKKNKHSLISSLDKEVNKTN